MCLQLVKIEEGLCSGEVLFHEYGKFSYMVTVITGYRKLKSQLVVWCYVALSLNDLTLQVLLCLFVLVKKTPEEIREMKKRREEKR